MIETEHEVADEQSAERRNEREAAAPEISAAEERHRTDRSEVGRVRDEPHHGGRDDRRKQRKQAGMIGVHKSLHNAAALA